MKQIIKSLFFFLTISCFFGLQSCNGQTNNKNFEHYFGDKVSFADLKIQDVESKKFIKDKIAKAELNSYTDGDTAVFYLPHGEEDVYTGFVSDQGDISSYNYVTIRFLGIDTPESTSSIEAWGKAASNYGKSLLKNAEGIIIDATGINTLDDDNNQLPPEEMYTSGVRLDSNGTRWLAMIWYCPEGEDPSVYSNYRSYQIDIIEECYSFSTSSNLGDSFVYFADKKKEPELYEKYADTMGSLKLSDVLLEAEVKARENNQRFTGYQQDPHYDYSKKPTECSITEAIQNFDYYASEGKFVKIKGVVTSFIGTNFYLQDEQGTPLYVYMGISADGSFLDLVEVGYTIKISGRMAEYGGQKQLSGVDWSGDNFEIVTDNTIAMPQPISISSADAKNKNKLDEYIGKLVKVNLNISSSKPTGKLSKDKSYTINSTNVIENLGGQYNYLNVRVNGSLAPGYDYTEVSETYVGKDVTVTSILSIYSVEDYTKESYPSYQLVLGNRKIVDGQLTSDIIINSK